MKISKNTARRGILLGLLAAAGSVALPAAADNYPSRPIRMIIGFPAGQSSDVVARFFAGKLSEELKQTVYVENKVGATGIIAHEFMKSVEPDGYTILTTSGAPLAINPALYSKINYDPVKDFAPIILTNVQPMFLAANPQVPVSNVGEMKTFVADQQGKVNYGSGGNGVTTHIVTEMFKGATGMDMAHVPYKGAPAMLTDLIAGRVQFAFETSTVILPQAANGRLKLLGVTSAKRSPAAPDVPTLQEQGVTGFEATTWAGMVAPARTPPEVINKLNAAMNVILRKPETISYLASIAAVPGGGTPQDFGRFIANEVSMWGKAVKLSGARVD